MLSMRGGRSGLFELKIQFTGFAVSHLLEFGVLIRMFTPEFFYKVAISPFFRIACILV